MVESFFTQKFRKMFQMLALCQEDKLTFGIYLPYSTLLCVTMATNYLENGYFILLTEKIAARGSEGVFFRTLNSPPPPCDSGDEGVI